MEEAHQAFVVLALSGLSRWKSFVEITKELSMDSFQYRANGEEEYIGRLVALGSSLVELRKG